MGLSTFTAGSALTGAATRIPREPSFLAEARARRAPADVIFPGLDDPMPPPSAAPITHAVRPSVPAPPAEPMPPPPPAVPAAPPQPLIDFGERVAAAVGALRLTAERLNDQVRSDALELALLVARRIVETELSTNVEPLFGMIRSLARRVGETRRITVRLCPADAARVEDARGGKPGIPGVAAAEIEVRPDASLSPGDCVVDADFGMIDGRLDTRFEELRRIFRETVGAGAGHGGAT